jgi:prolyl 4-hydroxylase
MTDITNLRTLVKAQQFESALSGYRSLAESGDVNAMLELGNLILTGGLENTEAVEGLAWLAQAEKNGSAQAKYFLALSALSEISGPIDWLTFSRRITQSARLQYAPALRAIGIHWGKSSDEQLRAKSRARHATRRSNRDGDFAIKISDRFLLRAKSTPSQRHGSNTQSTRLTG